MMYKVYKKKEIQMKKKCQRGRSTLNEQVVTALIKGKFTLFSEA